MATIEKIQKITSKGQITLPVAWRRATAADTISVVVQGNVIKIMPVARREENDIVIFDAVRDNGGKGIPATEFIRVLRKMGAK